MQLGIHSRNKSISRRLWRLFFIALLAAGLAGGYFLWVQSGFSYTDQDNVGGRDLAFWQEQAALNPNNAQIQSQLGLAHLEAARITGNGANYGMAEEAFDAALVLDRQADGGYSGDSLPALIGQGVLALARHDFVTAMEIGQEARALNPFNAQVLGILVDANVELGRYDQAVNLAQEMVDLRPGLPAYSRIAYLRELHGDNDGAIEAMERAVSSGVPGSEEMAWTQVQLGNLYLNRGELDSAEATYREALQYRPEYGFALEGIGRIQALRGDLAAALDTFLALEEKQATADRAILLGQLYERMGDNAAAEAQYTAARHLLDHHTLSSHSHGASHTHATARNVGSGMNVDKEMALFEAEYGYPRRALRLARAAYEAQPNIYAADALAWALYKNGQYEEAWQYSQEAVRLGTADDQLYLHAAQIARALGEDEAAAEYEAKLKDCRVRFSGLCAAEAGSAISGSDG